ncbi:MAG: aminoglycoside N(3)-acetyltransferase [Acidimicrobiales bacterium]
MTEAEAIDRVDTPATVESLVADLRALGPAPGATVIVHSSLSRLGYVVGGAQAVVLSVLEAVGDDGTVVMPTHSSGLSDPAEWSRPPVPDSWWHAMRATMPAYDPALTPTRRMGAVVECFRHAPGFVRSGHPTMSMGAVGPDAEHIVETHPLHDGAGESSPLGRLYELDGWVLLLGVGHANNTSLHLAEHRATYPAKAQKTSHSPVMVDGQRQWVRYEELELDSDDFDQIGDAFAATGAERVAPVGGGTGRLVRVRDIVDFGVEWIERHRA